MASLLNHSNVSLAPMSAEDDGTHGNQSVPAMLRSIRELLNLHIELVTQSRASVSEESLSTVMGTLKPGKILNASRVKLLDEFPCITKLLGEISEEGEDGILKAEAIRKDLHSLIKKSFDLSTEHRIASAASKLFEELEKQYFEPIDKSSEEILVRPRCFAIQCLTLVTGQKAGQPWKRE